MKTAASVAALAWRYLWARPLQAVLNLLLLALGLAVVTLVLLVGTQIDRGFERDVQGIDLVVGAKGSPLQLILAGVFHIDVPPGNIALADFQELQRNPMVAQAIPLSLGDSFRGYRIVGTTPEYPAHYGATLAQGTLWQAPLQAVLGAGVAQAMAEAGDAQGGALIGRRFVGTHGLGSGGHEHGDHPYTVVGVLVPCGCVLDRLVLTSLESVWQVHEHAQADDPDDLAELRKEREVTLALVRYRSPLAAVTLPRAINSGTPMQAAAPAVEITRLLRLLGAPPRRVAGLLLAEALWLALLASALGLAVGHGLAALAGQMLRSQGSMPVSGALWLPEEWAVPALACAVACLAALLPVVRAYRTDVADLLAQP